MDQVLERLNAIKTNENVITENYQTELNSQSSASDKQRFNQTNINTSLNNDDSSHGDLPQLIENFDKITMLSEQNLIIIVNDIAVNHIFRITNEGKDSIGNKHILDYFNEFTRNL